MYRVQVERFSLVCCKIPIRIKFRYFFFYFSHFTPVFYFDGNASSYVFEVIPSNVNVNARLGGQGTNWRTVHSDSLSLLSVFRFFLFLARVARYFRAHYIQLWKYRRMFFDNRKNRRHAVADGSESVTSERSLLR